MCDTISKIDIETYYVIMYKKALNGFFNVKRGEIK